MVGQGGIEHVDGGVKYHYYRLHRCPVDLDAVGTTIGKSCKDELRTPNSIRYLRGAIPGVKQVALYTVPPSSLPGLVPDASSDPLFLRA